MSLTPLYPIRYFFGRRQTYALSKPQQKIFNEMLPQLKTDYDLLKSHYDQIWLEIGFGTGEHLIAQALNHPEVGIIGSEPFINGLVNIIELIVEHKLEKRIQLYDLEAQKLLASLADQSLDRCFVLFADPWPKRRHHKRRFIQMSSLEQIHRVLKPGSELRVASDDPDLIDWYDILLSDQPYFDLKLRTTSLSADRPTDWPKSKYEEKALRQGREGVLYTLLPKSNLL